MNDQPDLLALQFASAGAGFKPAAGQVEPLVWVKHLLLLREWKPGEENVIRHIELHPGLNFLWAKPRPQTETGGNSSRTERDEASTSDGHAIVSSWFLIFVTGMVRAEPTPCQAAAVIRLG